MMKIAILLSVIVSPFFSLSAQKEGDTWLWGYYSGGNEGYGINFLHFSSNELILEYQPHITSRFLETDASVCDENGNVILWTNGMQIHGKDGVRITDTIAFDIEVGELSYWKYYEYAEINDVLGFPKHDGAIILPIPESENRYMVIYHTADVFPRGGFRVVQLFSTEVRLNADSTFTLINKDRKVGPEIKFLCDNILATRHANGRDWWITIFRADSPLYYTYILDPDGVHQSHIGEISLSLRVGLGQASFSNSGSYMARMDAITQSIGQNIALFQFDRCVGEYTLLDTFNMEAGYFTGVAFSNSDRYLYANENRKLWQFDLWSADISASRVLVDTFDGFIEPGWFATSFGPIKIAPDGRIYIAPSGGSSRRLHVIDRPDHHGKECRFLQHHIDLIRWNGRSMPNIPNYRLGPLDGSSCDTLGIDNHPQSRWRYEEYAEGYPYEILFTDLSFYDPDTWHWDFGDGHTSSTQSPIHTFEPGIYHVCLTVSNEYSSDSTCQWIEILPTNVKEERYSGVHDLGISPNPFSDYLHIQSRSGDFRYAVINMYDIHGNAVISQLDTPVPLRIQMANLPSGIYFCHIEDSDGSVYTQKVVKVE